MDKDILLILVGAVIGFFSSLVSTFIQSWIKKKEYKYQKTEERKEQLTRIILPTIEEIEKYSGKSGKSRPSFELLPPDPLVIIISGHFCSGKNAVIKHMKEENLPLHFVINTTTQPQNDNEIEGVDYSFISTAEFEQLIELGEFAEYTFIYGEYRGITKKRLIEAFSNNERKDILLNVDMQSAVAIQKSMPEAIQIFMTRANEEDVMVSCLNFQKANVTNLPSVSIDSVRQELTQINNFDYVIINTDVVESANLIKDIITTEHLRIHKRKVTL